VSHSEVEELQYEDEFLADGVDYQFVLAAENFFEMVMVLLLLTDCHHNRLSC
jgi:hypothetical protein